MKIYSQDKARKAHKDMLKSFRQLQEDAPLLPPSAPRTTTTTETIVPLHEALNLQELRELAHRIEARHRREGTDPSTEVEAVYAAIERHLGFYLFP